MIFERNYKMGLFDHQLDKNIPVPLYYQLKTLLEAYIENEHQNYDEPIPTEMEISEVFGISRPTVRQAINSLVVEGRLYRKKSKGTFVMRPKIHQNFLESIQSFNEEMQEKGLTPKTEVLGLEAVNCSEEVGRALQLEVGSRVIRLERLRYAGDEPIVHVISYLPHDLCYKMLNCDFAKVSMYHVMEMDLNLTIEYATRRLEAVLAGSFIAGQLSINKNAAIQYIQTIAYLTNGTPVEYSQANYRGDRSHFTFKLKR